jgi:chemotaxis receptor (MCP) glutamine deamidase CheD
MAAMKVESRPVELLTSVGSYVAICLYDSAHRCGGLAHIMLSHSAKGQREPLPSKFADIVVLALVKEILSKFGNQSRFVCILRVTYKRFCVKKTLNETDHY